jgi:hypothetical protein
LGERGDGDGDRTQRTQKLRKGRKKENTKKIPKKDLENSIRT